MLKYFAFVSAAILRTLYLILFVELFGLVLMIPTDYNRGPEMARI